MNLFEPLSVARPLLPQFSVPASQHSGKSLRQSGETKTPKKKSKKARKLKCARTVIAVPGGAALCQRIFTRIGCAGPPPAFRVEFYPYSSLTLTIRRRDGEMIVRLSDLLQRAPICVLEGAAALLLAKIYRRRTPRALVSSYNEYAQSLCTRQRLQNLRIRGVRL